MALLNGMFGWAYKVGPFDPPTHHSDWKITSFVPVNVSGGPVLVKLFELWIWEACASSTKEPLFVAISQTAKKVAAVPFVWTFSDVTPEMLAKL